MNNLRRKLPPLASLLPFEAATRLGSMSRAGEELGLTQAAISRQIRLLEENLGLALFERRNRAAFPTADAQELARIVGDALGRVANAADAIRRRSEAGVVLFAQLCEGLYWVMPHLADFYRQHPGISVEVIVSAQPVSQHGGFFDIALQTAQRDSGNMKPVFTVPDEVFPVCSPGLVAEDSLPLPLDRLGEFNLLHHQIEPQDWVTWDEWLAGIGSDARVGFNGSCFNSYPLMIQAALEGHGISLGWRQTCARMLSDGQLVRPFSESLPLEQGLAVYINEESRGREPVNILCDWLASALGNSITPGPPQGFPVRLTEQRNRQPAS